MAGKWIEKLYSFMGWMDMICRITGFSMLALCGIIVSGITYLTKKISNDLELAKTVCCFATIAALAVCIIVQIIIYYLNTKKLKKRISACKKALKTIDKSKLAEVSPVDFYLIDKEVTNYK